jgi:hypothetical protein
MDNEDDKKVKELLDEATRAEIERWFGLPSFEQLADEGKVAAPPPSEDPEVVAMRQRRDAAIAAVSPVLLAEHHRRVEPSFELVKFKPAIETRVDPGIAMVDFAMIERRQQIAEPRSYELPDDLEDELKERVPQALLRDLHRPEKDFTKEFELVDPLAEQRVDVGAIVAAVMTPTKLELSGSRIHEARTLIAEMRDQRRRPWAQIRTPTRRVTE